MTDTIYDVAIIGAGPAGMTAGLYCGRANLSTIIFGNIFDSNLAKAGDVENYPGFESIQGIELVEKFNKQLGKYNVLQVPAYINRIIRDDVFRLITENGEFDARSVIISTGSKHRELNIPGEKEFNYKGVSYCAVCDGSFYKGKNVVLIGHGDQAAKSALYLAGLCKEVLILSNLPEIETTAYRDQILAQPNIREFFNVRVLALKGKENLEEVEYSIKGGPPETVKTDGVFIEGGTPNSVLAQELGLRLDERGNITVNRPDMTTEVEGVFAAGDVTGGIHQISKAVGEGACAAVSAALYLKKKKARKTKT
ncbi:MAG: Sulfide dehydrogenase subunit alpha precursor [Methanocella sp. PtaU1.Bin125]|nr:MAG: Sulfide dehydrogenase subunit alpha precursor [Methanocella sp. PtaU1.Bin125]